MASIFVGSGTGDKDHHPHHHRQQQNQLSPKNSFKKTWPSNPQPPTPSCAHGDQGGAVPKCVCAPATHAGSFKCRLHRVNSNGHSTSSAPPPEASDSSARTVEAQ
ncbi:unnamed protein product [Spirodela intermedia]|uniref:Uncharacterized protein n=1 Tax=Spirodela intermedia TaxID=51605 RepID=A0A7I8L5M3_SPIIN|nr:unnamed protein product [Spirodela intermedia]